MLSALATVATLLLLATIIRHVPVGPDADLEETFR
jgi:hypothetical protein